MGFWEKLAKLHTEVEQKLNFIFIPGFRRYVIYLQLRGIQKTLQTSALDKREVYFLSIKSEVGGLRLR